MGTSWEAFSLKFSFHLRVFLEIYFALKLSLIRFQNRICERSRRGPGCECYNLETNRQ